MTTIDQETQALIDVIKSRDTTIVINDEGEQAEAAKLLSIVKGDAKIIKQKKEAITKPLNATLKEVREQFKPAEDRLNDAETAIKNAMLAYHERVAAVVQKQIESIENDGRTKLATKMSKLADVAQPKTSLHGANIRYGKAMVQIVDPLLVPTAYLYSPSVIDAIRKEIQKDVDAGVACPAGAKLVRKMQVAGIA